MKSRHTPSLALPILFAVVFIDLVGFGILAPLIPFYVERLGARPELITLIIALHPLFQSLAMPLWGGLSDRIGRRPVLLVSMLGHAGSYLLLGLADSLWMLALARLLSGVTSANIGTAYTYISDITTVEERAGAMGKISAAFGLGFAIGPGLGGLLAGGTTMADANFLRPAVAASLFSLAAFFAILFFLPESLRKDAPGRTAAAGDSLWRDVARIARRPMVFRMIMLAVIVLVFMSVRESIFTLWANHQHGLSAQTLGALLAWTGLLMAGLQFFGLGRLTARFGEVRLIKTAIVCMFTGWLGLVLAVDIPTLLAAMTVASLGSAFFQACMQSLLSKRAGMEERGAVLGVYQSASAMSRFAGQAGAGTLYGQLGANAPFLLGSLAMLPAFGMAVHIGRHLRRNPGT